VRRFGTTDWSRLQGSICPNKIQTQIPYPFKLHEKIVSFPNSILSVFVNNRFSYLALW